MKEEDREITVLGETWNLDFLDYGEDPAFELSDGFVCETSRIIKIQKVGTAPKESEKLAFGITDEKLNQERVVRHEIIHAFLYESGLGESALETSSWATNEEMVDWFARQGPKIFKVYKELGIA